MKNFNSYYVDEFLIEKNVHQWVSKKTLNTYNTVFSVLLEDNNVDISDLSTFTAKAFKKFLWESLQKREWSSATYNNYRKCLKSFCNFLVAEEYLDNNPINKIQKRREPHRLPRSLNGDQVRELLWALEVAFDKEAFTGYRNIIMVHAYLHTGLRLSELTNLKAENLRLHDGYLKVEQWKWSKDRLVPIDATISRMLHDYLARRKKEANLKSDFLFPTVHGNSLKERDMRRIIGRLRYCVSFHFTWHQLRHTFATELVRNNIDIFNISTILWHAQISTTKIYLSADTQRLKRQIDRIGLFA